MNVEVPRPRNERVVDETRTNAEIPHVPADASKALSRVLLLLVVPVAATAVWVLGFVGADPRQMGPLGLVSLFNPATVGALVLLLAGFLFSLYRARPEWVLGMYLITYIALVHGTPPVLYGTLRYSWAHKHVGIVDYILRNGSVDPTIDVGQIYHNWPGFFAGSSLLTDLAGQEDALLIASWAPVAFNLMNLLVLRYVFRGLTRNRNLVWLGLMFFLLINWVGQDYFAPQALGFVLYLGVVGLLIRRMPRSAMVVPFVVIVVAMAVSHQITPMMMFLAVLGLIVIRRTRGWYLPVLGLLIVAGWAFTGAREYTLPNLADLVTEFGQVADNTDQNLEKASVLTGDGLLVVWGGRATVLVAGLTAMVGVSRHWFTHRRFRVTPIVLMVLPVVLVVTTGFGGEVLFRAYLFSSPFIAFLAADACQPRIVGTLSRRSMLAATVVVTLVTPGFFLGYYGKERQNYFTPAEVEAAAWVDTHARQGSLLVEGSTNYPTRFLDYEKFTYVPIDREPRDAIRDLVAEPAGQLAEWLDSPEYQDGYVLITRGQKIATETEVSMPQGGLERIEQTLRESNKFEVVYQTPDATVFALVHTGAKQ